MRSSSAFRWNNRRRQAKVIQQNTRTVINMTYQTMVAAFDTPDHAQAAVNALKVGGFHGDDISILDKAYLEKTGGATKQGLDGPGTWRRIFGGDVREHEAAVFRRTIAEGGRLVSVRVPDNEVAHAAGILDMHRPIDVADRAITTGLAPAPRVETAAKEIAETPIPADQRIATTPKAAKVHGDVLRLAEEQLEVGKERVETGRTRVRRFTTEREVSSDVSLHDEYAEVLRRAATEPASFNDVDWSDNEIEMVETAEHALVAKTARVVEEIGLKKVGVDHVETIREKLRRQQAQVDRFDAAGESIASPRA
jgi:uncharacterized protein (TIGR02271 family)